MTGLEPNTTYRLSFPGFCRDFTNTADDAACVSEYYPETYTTDGSGTFSYAAHYVLTGCPAVDAPVYVWNSAGTVKLYETLVPNPCDPAWVTGTETYPLTPVA